MGEGTDKHLFAMVIDGQIYRDEEGDAVTSAQMHQILHDKLLPEGYSVYHYSSDEQWARVLAFPLRPQWDLRILTEVDIATSPYGICRRCRSQPADGLWKGFFPNYNDFGELLRVSPYKGYVCEQCAQNLQEGSGVLGHWLKGE